eukprot:CAMPEP_0198468940 /NCGR_PEP_ID=MMETSP1456-20131121/10379_1 /TAXON_ID=1461544 ORGANISM="Unidentified sp., Strain RCC1871" /NCGR_SAMPLE_ID=MMETSP1456 /ASSEMBLY_ACC=CAM_ASM_001119 /LENGTH=192 /DNA_ID=CAMNT_0044195259 /DNA_START=411 /DNA_END=990 /DNA_ORIENTATION=+
MNRTARFRLRGSSNQQPHRVDHAGANSCPFLPLHLSELHAGTQRQPRPRLQSLCCVVDPPVRKRTQAHEDEGPQEVGDLEDLLVATELLLIRFSDCEPFVVVLPEHVLPKLRVLQVLALNRLPHAGGDNVVVQHLPAQGQYFRSLLEGIAALDLEPTSQQVGPEPEDDSKHELQEEACEDRLPVQECVSVPK